MIDLVKQLMKHEGVRLKPYVDTVGKLTIGIGRNLDDVGITLAEAKILLEHDIEVAKLELERALPFVMRLSPNRRLALVNMVFNMGIGRLLGFKNTLKHLEQGNFDAAATEMLDSKWARQVGSRALELSEQVRNG